MSGEDQCSTEVHTTQPHSARPPWRNRIGPLQKKELVEIRPGRWLKILHIKAAAGGGDQRSSNGDERQDQSLGCLTVKGDNTLMVIPSEKVDVGINTTEAFISRKESEVNTASGETESDTSHEGRAPLAKTEDSIQSTDKKDGFTASCKNTKEFEKHVKDDDEPKGNKVTSSSDLCTASQLEQDDHADKCMNLTHLNNINDDSGGSNHIICTTATGSSKSLALEATSGTDKLNPPEKNLDLPSSTKTHNINHSNSNVNDSGIVKDKCKLETFYDKTRSRTVPNQLYKGKDMPWLSEDDVPPSDTVLFFLHGVGGSYEVWMAQINYFAAKGYQIVAPDLLGHGQSSAPEMGSAYHFREHARDMTAIFERYSGKRNVVIGHSYGCTFCTLLAHEQGQRMSRLVMVSGGAPSPLEPQPCHIFCLPVCLLDCISPMLVKCFLRRAFSTQGQLSTVEDMHKSFNVPAHVLRGTMVGQVWHEGDEGYHTEIEVPTLLIHGRQDGLVPLQDEYGMEEALPYSHLEVIEDVSHMVMMECPDKVNQLIHDFILQDSEELFSQKHVNRSPSRASQKHVNRSPSRASLKSTSKAIPAHLLTS